VLTKARIEAPFPAFLVYHICNLPPMRWLVGPTLGPHSGSCNVTQPILADPHLTTFGKNVVIGYGASIAAHTQDRDGVTIARTTVEDEALIGAHALIYGGCTIKRGAMILGGAVLRPFTVVGEHEVWGGVPAKKLQVSAPANKQ
jgi:acetyltransferase-like isoleucine patch superfamily enzyme